MAVLGGGRMPELLTLRTAAIIIIPCLWVWHSAPTNLLISFTSPFISINCFLDRIIEIIVNNRGRSYKDGTCS